MRLSNGKKFSSVFLNFEEKEALREIKMTRRGKGSTNPRGQLPPLSLAYKTK